MLQILRTVEAEMARLLEEEGAWRSVLVDYHPPVVERVWREWGDYRVNLHRIHPCGRGDALFHPHPWPSAMHVLSGTYEMAVGYGPGLVEPPIAALMVTSGNFRYEMTDPDGWHYVRPLGGPAMSLMVTGKPWNRPAPKSSTLLHPLSPEQKEALLRFFRTHYAYRNRAAGAHR